MNRILSVQESRIEHEIQTGKPIISAHNRAMQLLLRSRNRKPVIDVERGYYFTESKCQQFTYS